MYVCVLSLSYTISVLIQKNNGLQNDFNRKAVREVKHPPNVCSAKDMPSMFKGTSVLLNILAHAVFSLSLTT
jgi:hypothetical protein